MNDKPAGNSELNMFRVTESFLKGKHSEEDNEDAIFVGGAFAAVIDGATSKTTFRKDGKTTGQWAAQCVVEALRTLPAAATCQEAVSAVTRHIQRFYAIHHLEEQVEKTSGIPLYGQCRHLQCCSEGNLAGGGLPLPDACILFGQ